MKILSLPPPHHWETTAGTPVEGWAEDEGMVYPIIYDARAQQLVVWTASVRPKTFKPEPTNVDGRYMPDDPRKGAA